MNELLQKSVMIGCVEPIPNGNKYGLMPYQPSTMLCATLLSNSMFQDNLGKMFYSKISWNYGSEWDKFRVMWLFKYIQSGVDDANFSSITSFSYDEQRLLYIHEPLKDHWGVIVGIRLWLIPCSMPFSSETFERILHKLGEQFSLLKVDPNKENDFIYNNFQSICKNTNDFLQIVGHPYDEFRSKEAYARGEFREEYPPKLWRLFSLESAFDAERFGHIVCKEQMTLSKYFSNGYMQIDLNVLHKHDAYVWSHRNSPHVLCFNFPPPWLIYAEEKSYMKRRDFKQQQQQTIDRRHSSSPAPQSPRNSDFQVLPLSDSERQRKEEYQKSRERLNGIFDAAQEKFVNDDTPFNRTDMFAQNNYILNLGKQYNKLRSIKLKEMTSYSQKKHFEESLIKEGLKTMWRGLNESIGGVTPLNQSIKRLVNWARSVNFFTWTKEELIPINIPKFQNLSSFGNWVVKEQQLTYCILKLKNNFKEFFIAKYAIGCATMNGPFNTSGQPLVKPNLIIAGDPGGGKTFIMATMEQQSNVIENITYMSHMALLSGDKDQGERVMYFDDVPQMFFAEGSPFVSCLKEINTKNSVTSVTAYVDQQQQKKKQKTSIRKTETSVIRNNSLLVFLTNHPVDFIPSSMFDRTLLLFIPRRYGGEFPLNPQESDKLKLNNSYKAREFIKAMWDSAITAEILPEIDMSMWTWTKNKILEYFQKHGQLSKYFIPSINADRKQNMWLAETKSMLQHHAIDCEFFNASNFKPMQSIEDLQRLKPWSFCNKEMALFTLTLLSEHLLPETIKHTFKNLLQWPLPLHEDTKCKYIHESELDCLQQPTSTTAYHLKQNKPLIERKVSYLTMSFLTLVEMQTYLLNKINNIQSEQISWVQLKSMIDEETKKVSQSRDWIVVKEYDAPIELYYSLKSNMIFFDELQLKKIDQQIDQRGVAVITLCYNQNDPSEVPKYGYHFQIKTKSKESHIAFKKLNSWTFQYQDDQYLNLTKTYGVHEPQNIDIILSNTKMTNYIPFNEVFPFISVQPLFTDDGVSLGGFHPNGDEKPYKTNFRTLKNDDTLNGVLLLTIKQKWTLTNNEPLSMSFQMQSEYTHFAEDLNTEQRPIANLLYKPNVRGEARLCFSLKFINNLWSESSTIRLLIRDIFENSYIPPEGETLIIGQHCFDSKNRPMYQLFDTLHLAQKKDQHEYKITSNIVQNGILQLRPQVKKDVYDIDPFFSAWNEFLERSCLLEHSTSEIYDILKPSSTKAEIQYPHYLLENYSEHF